MPYNYVILGAGRQGCAIAYDLAAKCEAERIILVDTNTRAAGEAVDRLQRLLPDTGCSFGIVTCDVTNLDEIGPVISGADVVVSWFKDLGRFESLSFTAAAHWNDTEVVGDVTPPCPGRPGRNALQPHRARADRVGAAATALQRLGAIPSRRLRRTRSPELLR